MLIGLSIFSRVCCLLILKMPNWGLSASVNKSKEKHKRTLLKHTPVHLYSLIETSHFYFTRLIEQRQKRKITSIQFRCTGQAVNSGSIRGLVQPLMWLPWLRAHPLTTTLYSYLIDPLIWILSAL